MQFKTPSFEGEAHAGREGNLRPRGGESLLASRVIYARREANGKIYCVCARGWKAPEAEHGVEEKDRRGTRRDERGSEKGEKNEAEEETDAFA